MRLLKELRLKFSEFQKKIVPREKRKFSIEWDLIKQQLLVMVTMTSLY